MLFRRTKSDVFFSRVFALLLALLGACIWTFATAHAYPHRPLRVSAPPIAVHAVPALSGDSAAVLTRPARKAQRISRDS